MVMMRFSCPHCRKALNVRDELAGRKAKCPGCSAVFRVPAAGAAPARPTAAPAAADCPNCKEDLPVGALLCVKCGYDTRTGKTLRTDLGGD